MQRKRRDLVRETSHRSRQRRPNFAGIQPLFNIVRIAMTTFRAVPVLSTLALLATIDAHPATAEVYRPWCVQYAGTNGDDASKTKNTGRFP
jgi:hypothetical protein